MVAAARSSSRNSSGSEGLVDASTDFFTRLNSSKIGALLLQLLAEYESLERELGPSGRRRVSRLSDNSTALNSASAQSATSSIGIGGLRRISDNSALNFASVASGHDQVEVLERESCLPLGLTDVAEVLPSEPPAPPSADERPCSPRQNMQPMRSDTPRPARVLRGSCRRPSLGVEALHEHPAEGVESEHSPRSPMASMRREKRWDSYISTESFSDGTPALQRAAARASEYGSATNSDAPTSVSVYDGSTSPSIRTTRRSFRQSQCGTLISSFFPKIHEKWVIRDGGDEEEEEEPPVVMGLSRMQMRKNSIRLTKGPSDCGLTRQSETKCLRRIAVHPYSPKRFTWDVLAVIVLFYDVVCIPLDWCGFLSVSDDRTAVAPVDTATSIFWTTDIILSFCTGVYMSGTLEMRPKQIAMSYLQGWFSFDVVCAMMDWVHLGLANSSTELSPFSGGRVSRMLRTLRLARGYKLQQKLARVLEEIRSERLQNWLNISVLALVILVACHYMACGWYLIGVSGQARLNWIDTYIESDRDALYKYLTALHWSLTQFTPATMEVMPRSNQERLYATVTVFVAMMTFSTFVSSITTHMTNLRRITSEAGKQQRTLHNFFMEHKISAELGHMIWRFLKNNHITFKERLHIEDVDVFKVLPRDILGKLTEELYVPHLKHCPFFFALGLNDYTGLVNLCHSAVSEQSYAPGVPIFNEGHRATAFYFVFQGHCMYEHRDARLSIAVSDKSWACEQALWFRWLHCGTLACSTSVEVLKVPAEAFRAIVGESGSPSLLFIKTYVKHLVEHMISFGPLGIWATDVWLDKEALEAVVEQAQDESMTFGRYEDEWPEGNAGEDFEPSAPARRSFESSGSTTLRSWSRAASRRLSAARSAVLGSSLPRERRRSATDSGGDLGVSSEAMSDRPSSRPSESR